MLNLGLNFFFQYFRSSEILPFFMSISARRYARQFSQDVVVKRIVKCQTFLSVKRNVRGRSIYNLYKSASLIFVMSL